ncbi:MAG: protein kinase [Planctomycetales bacterium]|nr:protein kinase [Planctomycetales bacterium]
MTKSRQPNDEEFDPHGTLRPGDLFQDGDCVEHVPANDVPVDQTLALPDRDAAIEQLRQLHERHLHDGDDPEVHSSDRTVSGKHGKTIASDQPTTYDPASAQVGQQFGDYELLSVIAKGGMGVVYKARQRTLNRVVAVKMILSGHLANEVDVERFRTEAEAAARLNHRHIVAVHEIGAVDGQHFFSMDYVDGSSLSELVRESPLTPQLAARYVRDVALAMDYAHSHGILHRDLKPSNVLVNLDGEPCITDFGLAKRVEENSQLTITGMIVGTPSYMPPEQAIGSQDKIGVRSDVYATGALLYELLTAAPPFRAATPFETIRQVLDVEPVPPRTVNPSVPQDLETICLKALQKDPSNRYASEKALADELDRFLEGRPILARPLGWPTRTVRWVRRNPVVAGWAAAAACLLVSTLVATTVGYFQTKAALNDSRASLRQALAVVDNFCVRVSEDKLLNEPGLQPVRRDLLQDALQYLTAFARENSDRSLDFELAKSHYRIGLITEEIESVEAALPWLDKAIQMQMELRTRFPRDPKYSAALGEAWNAIGRVHNRMRNVDGVRDAYRNAIRFRSEVVALTQNAHTARLLANSHMNMGIFERQQQNMKLAKEQMKLAQATRIEFLPKGKSDEIDSLRIERDYAMGCYNLGVLESFAGNPADGKAHLQEALKRFADLVKREPDDLSHQYYFATSHRVLGELMLVEGDATAADQAYQTARRTIQKLADENSSVLEYQVSLAELNMSLGELQAEQELNQEAARWFQQAIDVLKPLVESNPEVPRFRCNLAVALREFAVSCAITNDEHNAWKTLREAERILTELTSELPSENEYQTEFESTTETIGWLKSFLAEPTDSK